ncbi:MAG: response regulator [Proteobacteria bacterium]|nr:response regulator [Pseudomonadota bacterium]
MDKASLKNISILIADDNEINRRFVVHALRDHGPEIIEAENGAEAILLANELQPDILLMDIHMPEINGLEALHKIHEWGNNNDYRPQSIALTADAREEERERLLANGFDAWLSKPVTGRNLVAAINNLLTSMDPSIWDRMATGTGYYKGLDDEQALSAAHGSSELVKTLRGIFARELAGIPDQLDLLMVSGKYDEVAEHIHKLIASAGYCGAPRLAAISRQFYTALRERNHHGISSGYARFMQGAAMVYNELLDAT